MKFIRKMRFQAYSNESVILTAMIALLFCFLCGTANAGLGDITFSDLFENGMPVAPL
jgi:hypothetical protein